MVENQSESEVRSCPLCEAKPNDILKHLRLQHSIESMEQLELEIGRIEKKKKNRDKFAAYVGELKERIRKKEITFEEYRQLINKWTQENSR